MNKINNLLLKAFTYLLITCVGLSASAQTFISHSCTPDTKTFSPVNNVTHTGVDILDKGYGHVVAYVNDGSRPKLTVILNSNFLPGSPIQASLPNSAIHPDVAIFNDALNTPTDCYIHVVYYNITTNAYMLEIYYLNLMMPSLGISLFQTYNLGAMTYGSGPNIDVSELGINGAITYAANNFVYGRACNLSYPGMAPSGICIVAKGTNSDVASCAQGDFHLFTYVSNNNIKVKTVSTNDLITLNANLSPVLSYSGVSVDNPRIAADAIQDAAGNWPWEVVWTDNISGHASSVFGNRGHIQGPLFGIPVIVNQGTYNIEYTNSNTWINGASNPTDLSNWIYAFDITNPRISFNHNSEIQVGFEVAHNDFRLQLPCSENLLVGVVCDNTGEPTNSGCAGAPSYQFIPFSFPAQSCAPSGVYASTGTANQEYCKAISLAGKNSFQNEFISVYFDDVNCLGYNCQSELAYKVNYNIGSGFRQSKPKTESGNNLTASKLILTISPNPFTENIKISSTNNDAVCNLIITDISGREILNTTSNIANLNTAITTANATLNSGIYFINIKNDSGILLNQKIVKQ
jgi:hypothetical protein